MAKSKSKTPADRGDTYHHGDLRQTLLNTALELLKKQSPDSLSLRELARLAGVSIAAPYRHFKDKNELLAALMQEGFELKFRYMVEAVKVAKGDPREMYFGIGLAYFRMGLKHPQHFRLMFGSGVVPGPDRPELMGTACKTFILLMRVIEYSQRKGLVGAGDPYHKAMNCWCVVNGFTALFAEGRLAWLGVDAKNAEAALKTLLSQYLLGNREPLKNSDFGFRTFATPDSDMLKKQMIETPVPEIEELFAPLS